MTDLDNEAYWNSLINDTEAANVNGRPAAGTSWRPVDLTPILDGTRPRPEPTVLTRTDGQGLLYPSRTHAIVGESEAAKSWLAQYACAQQIIAGHTAVYLDFEDSAESVTERMTTLGITDKLLCERFGYIAPEESIEPSGRTQLGQALLDLRPTIIILDGVTEAMALHSLKSVDNDDLATFGRLVTRPLTATGAAVVALDHQAKNIESRGRYALGGVHKLNALTGASIIAENVAPFGVGLRGITRLRIAKDRPGQLRTHGLPSDGGLRWIGDFILDTSDLAEPAFIQPPSEAKKAADDWRPTSVMEKTCQALEKAKRPLSKTEIRARVKGRADVILRALAILIDEGYIEEEAGPRGSTHHVLRRMYYADRDESESPEELPY